MVRFTYLVLLWLCLTPALGFPVAKRLSGSEVGEDVLAGSDFLSVFMKTSPVRSVDQPSPSFKYENIFGARTKANDYSETNSVLQKSKEDIRNIYGDINLKGEEALTPDLHVQPETVTQPQEDNIRQEYRITSLPQDTTMPPFERNVTDYTTASPTTTALQDDTASTYYDLEEEGRPVIVQGFREDRSTKPTLTQYWPGSQLNLTPVTPESENTSDQPLQVISVRVSSSVVRHSQKVEDPVKVYDNDKAKSASTLVTQEQPTITAIQRSHLNVEEAAPPVGRPSSLYHDVEPPAPHISKLIPQLRPPILSGFRFSNLEKSAPIEEYVPKIINNERRENNNQNIPDFSSVYREVKEESGDAEEIKNQQTDFLKIRPIQNDTRLENKENKKDVETPLVNKEAQALAYDYQQTSPPINPVEDYSKVDESHFESRKAQESKEQAPQEPHRLAYNYPQSSPQINPVRDYSKLDGAIFEARKSQENKEQAPQALAYHYNPQNPQIAPVSYHTSVSSATSGSSVQFYREPPSYRRGAVAETIQRATVAETKRDFPYHQPPKPQHEEPMERSYELPEQNYEVDEAVSVVTNGRAHGVQIPTPPPTQESTESDSEDKDNHKFGYVVEGRNFRKYRVEEKTPDGFIVGEYGVVSHDDGSLRGVRYTADSTINPRLIYDALVKFLSLK